MNSTMRCDQGGAGEETVLVTIGVEAQHQLIKNYDATSSPSATFQPYGQQATIARAHALKLHMGAQTTHTAQAALSMRPSNMKDQLLQHQRRECEDKSMQDASIRTMQSRRCTQRKEAAISPLQSLDTRKKNALRAPPIFSRPSEGYTSIGDARNDISEDYSTPGDTQEVDPCACLFCRACCHQLEHWCVEEALCVAAQIKAACSAVMDAVRSVIFVAKDEGKKTDKTASEGHFRFCHVVDRWVKMASHIDVLDMEICATHDSHDQLRKDLVRLAASGSEKSAISSILYRFCERYPGVGYNQGYDYACLAIYIASGKDMEATLTIFSKWAVPAAWILFGETENQQRICIGAMDYVLQVMIRHAPGVRAWLYGDENMGLGLDNGDHDGEVLLDFLFRSPLASMCSRQGLPKAVMDGIIEKTLEHGTGGPAVSLWAVLTLICSAHENLSSAQDVDRDEEYTLPAKHAERSARKTRSFKELEDGAPIALDVFVNGYSDTMARFLKEGQNPLT